MSHAQCKEAYVEQGRRLCARIAALEAENAALRRVVDEARRLMPGIAVRHLDHKPLQAALDAVEKR